MKSLAGRQVRGSTDSLTSGLQWGIPIRSLTHSSKAIESRLDTEARAVACVLAPPSFSPGPADLPPSTRKQTRLCIDEEQQFFKDIYELFLLRYPEIQLVPKDSYFGAHLLGTEGAALGPDVMLLGCKVLDEAYVQRARLVWSVYPSTGIVLLSGRYDLRGLKALRELCGNTSPGLACVLKHSVNTVQELVDIIRGVRKGRFILDREIMETMVVGRKAPFALLTMLTPREMEILRWAATGYNDRAIAGALEMEGQALRKCFDHIYSKLDIASSMDPRVDAVMQYVRAFGACPPGNQEPG